MTTINTHQIETLFRLLIDNLHKANITELSFSEDEYWNIPTESMSSFPGEPELTIGSLDDDVRFLTSLIDEQYETRFLELARLSSLLKFMSKKLSMY